jgi:hypothetical protein
MNIKRILTNLDNTIRGKEMLLAEWKHSDFSDLRAVAHYLEVNIGELKKIRADVEKCAVDA